MSEISKTDKIGCVFTTLGAAISQLDDKFGDENGHIKIDSFEKAVEAGTLLYSTFKAAYACTGKEFEVAIPGAWGKIISLILDALDEQNPKPIV